MKIRAAVLIGGLTLVACKGSSVVDSLEGKDAATASVEGTGSMEAGAGGSGGAGGAGSGGGAGGAGGAGGESAGGA
ncbi:MAG: hypothetical protein HYV09_25760, partial [Deltaproteobacteria bacterium]|nr:hypothetical protein [Deltaproteobacteria bacterium]